ncbi:MAG: universal stress protein [Cyanobacteriota bacterium]|jgi:nucleotide-binding universal stress UspA family protein|nr:universal stress protein [Synechococcus sp. FGCU3]MEB3104740.1 universal stress protein [Cyanobacteriota bacterium]
MSYSHLLVPVDGSDLGDHAIAKAVELAKTLGARITFFHAEPGLPVALAGLGEQVDPRTLDMLVTASREQTREILQQACRSAQTAGVNAESRSAMNPIPAEAIVDTAAEVGADLIVMASHGRRGLGALLLGSETQKVLTHSSLPVLVVR